MSVRKIVSDFKRYIPRQILRRLPMPFKNTGKWTVRVTPKTDGNNYAPSFEYPDLSKTQARALIRKLVGLWNESVQKQTHNIEVVEDPNGTINAFMPLFIQQLAMEQESEYVENETTGMLEKAKEDTTSETVPF